jgi:septal ring factor EnvC (AmiA/AmiB activator)
LLLRHDALKVAALLLAAAAPIVRAETAASSIEVASAKVSVSKRKLTQVQRDLEKKRKDLERYRRKMAKLQQRVGQEQDQIETFRSERERLESTRRLAAVEGRRMRSRLDSMGGGLQSSLAKAGYSAELYYSRSVHASPYVSGDSLWAAAALRRQLSAELDRCREQRERYEAATQDTENAVERAEGLLARARDAKQREREAERRLRRRQKELVATRARLEATESRVKGLEASASELDRLVAALAKRRRQAAKPYRAAPSAAQEQEAEPAVSSRNSLPWPAEGRLVSRFGRQRLEGIGTPIVHRGIRIATEPEAPVASVRSGRVVYAGPFRSYGDVVIVDHGSGLVTVYGHLGRLLKAAGDEVAPGDAVGVAGSGLDAEAQLAKLPEGRGSVYFEIRKGNKAVDPLMWLRRR